MTKLTQPTPRINVIIWQIGTFIFLLSMFINEHYDLLLNIGFKEQAVNIVRVVGVFIYKAFTFYNFNQSKYDKKPY